MRYTVAATARQRCPAPAAIAAVRGVGHRHRPEWTLTTQLGEEELDLGDAALGVGRRLVGDEVALVLVAVELRTLFPLAQVLDRERMDAELRAGARIVPAARLGEAAPTAACPVRRDQPVELVDPIGRELLDAAVALAGQDGDRVQLGVGHGEQSVDRGTARHRAGTPKCARIRYHVIAATEIPMGWLPEPVERLLEVALVGELTVVGRNGRPITHPLIPLYHDGRDLPPLVDPVQQEARAHQARWTRLARHHRSGRDEGQPRPRHDPGHRADHRRRPALGLGAADPRPVAAEGAGDRRLPQGARRAARSSSSARSSRSRPSAACTGTADGPMRRPSRPGARAGGRLMAARRRRRRDRAPARARTRPATFERLASIRTWS